jgi:hypothetical protein
MYEKSQIVGIFSKRGVVPSRVRMHLKAREMLCMAGQMVEAWTNFS